MQRDVINIGKIPLNERFNYFKTLQLISKSNDQKQIEQLKSNLQTIVRRIESKMNISEKIENYNPKEWKYIIEDDCSFWMMKNEYIERNFILTKKE